MKKIFYLVIAVLLLSAIPEISFAQSNDPFDNETLKATGTTTKREKKIDRKKKVETEEVTPAKPQPQPQPKPVVEEVKVNDMVISNPCDEWLDFELVSLVGSRGSQTVKLTAKITNHKSNKRMYVGGNFIAYDCEGEEHRTGYYSGYDMLTDITVKFSLDIPGKINPANTKIMPVISFNIDDCRIELRNVPIDWK